MFVTNLKWTSCLRRIFRNKCLKRSISYKDVVTVQWDWSELLISVSISVKGMIALLCIHVDRNTKNDSPCFLCTYFWVLGSWRRECSWKSWQPNLKALEYLYDSSSRLFLQEVNSIGRHSLRQTVSPSKVLALFISSNCYPEMFTK